jgi:hypothetical protein
MRVRNASRVLTAIKASDAKPVLSAAHERFGEDPAGGEQQAHGQRCQAQREGMHAACLAPLRPPACRCQRHGRQHQAQRPPHRNGLQRRHQLAGRRDDESCSHHAHAAQCAADHGQPCELGVERGEAEHDQQWQGHQPRRRGAGAAQAETAVAVHQRQVDDVGARSHLRHRQHAAESLQGQAVEGQQQGRRRGRTGTLPHAHLRTRSASGLMMLVGSLWMKWTTFSNAARK